MTTNWPSLCARVPLHAPRAPASARADAHLARLVLPLHVQLTCSYQESSTQFR